MRPGFWRTFLAALAMIFGMFNLADGIVHRDGIQAAIGLALGIEAVALWLSAKGER